VVKILLSEPLILSLFLGVRFRVSVFSPSAGQKKRPVKSKKKLMNVEHRTSNIERRILMTLRFID